MSDLYINNKKVTGIKPPGSDAIIPLTGKRLRGIKAILGSSASLNENHYAQSDEFNRFDAVRTLVLKDQTRITQNCFKNFTSLEYIVLPESIIRIRENAFTGCTSLTDIYFEGSAPPHILDDAFSGLTFTAHYHQSPEWDDFVSDESSSTVGSASHITWEVY